MMLHHRHEARNIELVNQKLTLVVDPEAAAVFTIQ